MKKTFLSLLGAAVIGAVAFSSCKKDDDGGQTRTQMVVGTWTSDFDAEDDNNNNTLDASEKITTTGSNIATIQFNADGSGTTSGGGIVGSLPFTWSLINNETQFKVSFSGFSDTSRIHTLTANSLIIEDEDGGDYYWTGFKK